MLCSFLKVCDFFVFEKRYTLVLHCMLGMYTHINIVLHCMLGMYTHINTVLHCMLEIYPC